MAARRSDEGCVSDEGLGRNRPGASSQPRSLGVEIATVATSAEPRAARAALTHAVLAELDRSPRASEVIERAGPDRVLRIRQMLAIAWVDLPEHLALVESLYGVIGPTEYTRFWRRVMVQTLSMPLVAGLVRMSTSQGPMRLLSRGQMLHGALTRGTGTLGIEALEGESLGVEFPDAASGCVLTLRGFPAREFSFPAYVAGIAGSILGACDRAGVQAEVVTHIVSEARGDARYEVRWTAAPSS